MYNKPIWFESPIQPAVTSMLSGAGLAGGLVTYQADGSASVWAGISQELGNALATAVRVTDQNGTPVVMTQFDQGWLANGCPLNVWFGQGWIAGQQDALRAGKITQCLPAAPLTQSVIPQAVTTQPPAGPPFTTTLTSGGIVTTPAAVAPQTNPGMPGAPSPVVLDSTGAPVPGSSTTTFDFSGLMPYAAITLIALLVLRKRG